MKYLRTFINFNENKTNDIIEPTINDIIQNGDEYTITIGDTTANGHYDGGVYSEYIPIWATKEFYLENIHRKGFNNNDKYKGYGKKAINLMIDKAKDLGADIFTLRVEDGYGFEGITSKLYSYYKKLGFKDIDEKDPDGAMYIDLRDNTNDSFNTDKNNNNINETHNSI